MKRFLNPSIINLSTQHKSLLNFNNSHNLLNVNSKGLWGMLNGIFNKYDKSRVEEVGPDRACAEWLIRCGAGVKWERGEEWFRDYNSLPPTNFKSLHITEVDGTESSIMHIGFPYFKGVKLCKNIILHKASYIEDEALKSLALLKDSLESLQISSCGNVTDDGIKSLSQLTKLKKLILFDLPEVQNKEECLQYLSKSLPGCEIEFSYAKYDENEKK